MVNTTINENNEIVDGGIIQLSRKQKKNIIVNEKRKLQRNSNLKE